MRKTTTKHEQPQNLKKKLMSALAMFLVATTLMTTTSYAWFVLSTAPEVTGITTNVGANGSLEIALLNAETRADMSLIRAGVGDSMVSNNPAANNAWGNLVDLGYQEYGLSDLLLLPSRLMVTGGDTYTVDTNMLAVPVYGYDGRIVELEQNTISAIYQNGNFAFSSGKQDYGVRAIGTSDALSAQGAALATAKANIPAYIKNANTAVKASLNSDLVGLIMKKAAGQDYDDTDLAILDATLISLDNALTTIDNTLRQGLVAYAASAIANEDTFNTVRNQITDPSVTLENLVSLMGSYVTVPGTFNTWVTELGEMKNSLNNARIALDALEGGTYTWDQIRGVMDYLMNMNGVYIGEKLFSEYSMDELLQMVQSGEVIEMYLRSGAGIYADMADFVGNYSASARLMNMVDATIETMSTVDPAYLNALNTAVQELGAADGGNETAVMPLNATYGYAIDLAFRCNAADPDLVLQTSAVQRVYSDSEAGSTQGGGSYMAFSSTDTAMTVEQRLALMDALRVAFVDDQGGILGVAKPNITTSTQADGMTKAPLYLYEYSFEADETGALLINFGERLKENNVITDLEQNVAKAVTAIVWLDGDIVDNTMVSATEVASLNGVLNLQFATSANLVPAMDNTIKNYTADASVLEDMLDPESENYDIGAIYTAGQGTYTTVSWTAFATAYEHAAAVVGMPSPGVVQVREASKALDEAYNGLQTVSKDAVNEKITELRDTMGTTDEVNGYIVEGENGLEIKTEYTETEKNSWNQAGVINRVDYANNNLEGEEGVQTPIYTDDSWNNLADALYNAEFVSQNPDATDEEVDAALTALENAQKSLQYQVAFLPHEYQETIYYKASYDEDAADIYGDWYDSSFKRVYSEVLMMKLDAYAEPVTLISMNEETYVAGDAKFINPSVSFLQSVYPELRDAKVKGVKWDALDPVYFTEMMTSRHNVALQNLLKQIADEGLDQLEKTPVDTTVANKMLTSYSDYKDNDAEPLYTAAEVDAQIADLKADMEKARDQKAKQKDAPATAEQMTLLNVAIGNAQAYIDANKESEDAEVRANVTALETAVTAGQAAYDKGDAATYGDARTAMNGLNDALDAAGLNRVVAKDYIVHQIPGATGSESIVYDSAYTDLVLKNSGKTGTTTLGATVLTEDGVVTKVSKTITIYDRATTDIDVHQPIILKSGGNRVANQFNMVKGNETTLEAALIYKQEMPGVVDPYDKKPEELVRETIAACTWASDNTNVVTVDASGKITAVGVGTTTISVSVQTEQGNAYVLKGVSVTVTDE